MNNLQIKEKQVTQIKIIGAKNLDPITVYLDERRDEEYQGCCDADVRYQGRIVIICYGMALNYFWSAMGEPMKNFFINASTGYIADKFEQNARETYRPKAMTGSYDENGTWQEKEVEVNFDMEDNHRKYICRVIEAVKAAFKEQLKTNGN